MAITGTDRKFANTLARGLDVLRAFRPTDNGLGNLEISNRTGIPRPTVTRLTYTLCLLGYLSHGRKNEKYRLGPAALALGNIAAASFSFIEIASPTMQRLADETGVLVGISIKDEQKMLMVKSWHPARSSSIWLDVGYRMPLLNSSSGKAYLGALNEDELELISQRLGEEFRTDLENVSAVRTSARDELLAVGFTKVKGEERFSEAINAVAVPYRPRELAEPVVFLASATAGMLTQVRIQSEVGPALAEAVREIRKVTGQRSAYVTF